jgi:ELWxxDGT repeat protein
MATTRSPAPLFVALLPLALSGAAYAQLATLVADLNTANSPFAASSSPGTFITLGSRLVFLAYQPTVGREWWATDGTAQGTELLADSCPGECSVFYTLLVGEESGRLVWVAEEDGTILGSFSRYWVTDGRRGGTYPLHGAELAVPYSPYGFDAVLAGGRLFFTAADEAHGEEVFVSDLDGGPPRLLRDIRPGGESSSPRGFEAQGGDALFLATDSVHGAGLWKSDGTTAGTTFVFPFRYGVGRIIPLGPRSLLLAQGATNRYDLWSTDGTAGGTFDLALPGSGGSPTEFTILAIIAGKAYFGWNDGQHGNELWESDGTRSGTRRISDLPASEEFDTYSGGPTAARLGGGLLFVTQDSSGSPRTLWRTDGNPGHTTTLGAQCTECTGFREAGLVATTGKVLFLGQDRNAGQELWATDGTPAGTRRVTDACPGPCGQASDLALLGGELYFVSRDQQARSDLWRAEGDGSGAVNLTDFRGRAHLDPSTGPLPIGLLGGDLYFQASTQESGGELWASGPIPGSAHLFADLVQGSESGNPIRLADLHGSLLFGAGGSPSCPLFKTLGTASTTVVLSEPGQLSTCIEGAGSMVVAGSRAVFMARGVVNPTVNLWGTDGVPGGAEQLTHYPFPGLSAQTAVVALGGDAYFFRGTTLWRTDGTAAGTVALFELPEEGSSVEPPQGAVRAVGAHIYFEANAGASSFERHLWRTDGTAGGTERLTSTPFSGYSFRPLPLAIVGGQVYYVLPGEFSSQQVLWASDGTSGGDQPVRTFVRGTHSPGILELVAFDGALYFVADVDESEIALWRSDGTFAGTAPVLSFPIFRPGEAYETRLTVFGDRLVFVADDGEHGLEPWTSDGTASSTALLADLATGSLFSSPEHLTAVGDRLYFTAGNGVHGRELWVSDGTSQGTRMVHDLLPGAASSNPEQLTASGGRLYFSADDQVRGRELWSLDLAASAGVCVPADGSLCLAGGRFRVDVAWKDFQNRRGEGHAVPLTADTGTFWFFNPANVEAIVKVLDGRPVNGHFWTFYGALSSVEYALTVSDASTGLARRYLNPSGRLASVGDTNSFGPLGAALESYTPPADDLALSWEPRVERLATRGSTGPCAPSPTRLCLNGGRFAVEAAWRDFRGNTGVGTGVGLTPDTGYFWFFRDPNVEVVLKVLDGRPVNGHFWVFYGALSSVEYTLTVTDTSTGETRVYENPSGRFASVGDTAAF